MGLAERETMEGRERKVVGEVVPDGEGEVKGGRNDMWEVPETPGR